MKEIYKTVQTPQIMLHNFLRNITAGIFILLATTTSLFAQNPPAFVFQPATDTAYNFTTIKNSQVNRFVGVISAIDPDGLSSLITYEIENNDTTRFRLDTVGITPGNTMLRVKNPALLQFDTTYSFRVIAKDGSGDKDTAWVFVTIPAAVGPIFQARTLTINENVPAGTFALNTVGPAVANITAGDPDGDSTLITYTLISGNTSGHFELTQFNGTAGLRNLANNIDYESLNTYNIVLRATDQDGLWAEATMTINVVNLNEPPVLTAQTTSITIPDNYPTTSVVYKVLFTDPDLPLTGHTHTFSIVSQTGAAGGSPFSINSDGEIKVANPTQLEFSNLIFPRIVSVVVRIVDGGTLTPPSYDNEKTYQIQITQGATPTYTFVTSNSHVTIENNCTKLSLGILTSMAPAPSGNFLPACHNWPTGQEVYYLVDRIERDLGSLTWVNPTTLSIEPRAYTTALIRQYATLDDNTAFSGREYAYRFRLKRGSEVCVIPNGSTYFRGHYSGKPATPININASTGNASSPCTSVQISWVNMAPNATHIVIKREVKTGGSFGSEVTVATVSTAVSSYTDTLPVADRGKILRYKIYARNANNAQCPDSDPGISTEAYSIGLTAKPLSLENKLEPGCGSVELKWKYDDLESSPSEKLYIWRQFGAVKTIIDSIGIINSEYIDNNPLRGGISTYTVQGVNQCGLGVESNPTTRNIASISPAPTAISTQTVEIPALNTNVLRINFTPATGTGQHKVFRNGINIATLNAGINTYDDVDAEACVLNEYSVASVNACDIGTLNTTLGRIVPILVLPAITASDGEFPNKTEVRWTDIKYESGYRITKDNQLLVITDEDVSLYVDENSIPGNIHTYTVQAVNNCYASNIRSDLGFTDPNGSISGHVSTPGGSFVKNVEVEVTPVVGKSIKLNGTPPGVGFSANFTANTANNYVDLGNNAINFASGFTVEFWAYFDQLGKGAIMSLANGSDDRFEISNEQGSSALTVKSYGCPNNLCLVTTQTNSGFLAANQWIHIAVTITPQGIAKIYKNGVLETTDANSVLPFGTATTNRVGTNRANNQYFNGKIDELRIWSSARSDAQITEGFDQEIPTNTSGLSRYVSFNSAGSAMDKVANHAGSPAEVTLVGSVALSTPSPAMQVVGGSYINVGTINPALVSNKSISLSMWVRSDPGNIKNAVVFGGGESAPGVEFTIGKTIMNVANMKTPNGSRISSTKPLNDQQWHNIIYVYDRPTQKMRIYVDGVKEAEGSAGVVNFTGWFMTIGAEQGGKFPFRGYIDDVSLWGIALDSAYISRYFNKGHSGDEEGIISYWKMDEGNKELTFDRTLRNYHGTLVHEGSLTIWANNTIAPVKNLGITDSLGNYFINAINYGSNVNGTLFTVTPSLVENGVTHVFNPQNRTRTLSFTSTMHNAVDFTDQSVMPISGYVKYKGTACFLQNTEFMLNGQSVNPVALTNSSGVWTIDAPFGIQSFGPRDKNIKPDSVKFFVDKPVANIMFESFELYKVKGRVEGRCNTQVGPVTMKIEADNKCFSKTVNVDVNGNYIFDSIPPGTVVLSAIPQNQLITFDPVNIYISKDTTVNFIYRTGLKVDVEIDTALNFMDNCGTIIKSIAQGEKSFANIRVYEEYPGGARCYLDSAKISILDDIADQPLPYDTSFTNNPSGTFKYVFTAGVPFLGGTGSTQYKKKLEVTVTDSSGRQETATEFILVQGKRQRASTFTTASPDIVFFVLRDPPGDKSFSYLSKDSTYCFSLNINNTTTIGLGFEIKVAVGVNITVGWVAEINIKGKAKPFVNFAASANFFVDYTDEYCVTLAENVQTNDDDLYVGREMDLYTGGALNYTFAKVDILTYDTLNCNAVVNSAIGTRPEGIETFFLYTEKHIKDKVIPGLEFLRDLPGNPTDSVTYWQKQITGWNKTIQDNQNFKLAASANDANMPIGGTTYNKNVSFSYGTNYSSEENFATTTALQLGGGFKLEYKTGVEFEVDIAGNGVEGKFEASISNEFKISGTTTNSKGRTVGYSLGDNDPGDFFSVNIKKDLKYKTPVFEIVAGESMCPHEDGTVQREKVQITALQNNKINIPADQPAVFDIIISNLSESEDGQRYGLAFWDGFQSGAVVMVNGQTLAGDNGYFVYNIPGDLSNNAVSLKITVDRMPGVYEHTGIVLAAFSDCEFGLYSSGGEINAFSTTTINAYWDKPCADIKILNPGEGWIVDNLSNDKLTVSFTGYDTSTTTNTQNFKLQYAQEHGAWMLASQVGMNTLFNSNPDGSTPQFASLEWNLFPSTPDGVYKLRVVAECPISKTETPDRKGIVSRNAPVVFGLPQPADGVLEPNDEISVTFNEDIDCSLLNIESVTLKGVLSGFDYKSNAVSFNGVDNYVSIPYKNVYNFGATNDFTIEMWIKTNFNAQDPAIVSNKNWNNGRNKGWVISSMQGNRWKFNIGDGNNMATVNGGIIGDGQWHHIAVAVDRDFGIILYQDGVEVGRDTVDIKTIGNINNTLPIGVAQDGTHNYAYYFQGQIDELRIWNTFKFQLNILQGRFRSYDFDEPNLVGCWRFDEGFGNTTLDHSINQNFAALHSGTQWVTQNTAPISMDDVESLISIKYYCAGNKIIIEPLTPIKYLENAFLTATVLDARDLHGNMIVQPVKWSFYVDKNPVRWENTNVKHSKQQSEILVFSEHLLNQGGFNEQFALTDIPSWLKTQNLAGTIPPSFKEKIIFTVDSFVNPGVYSQKIIANTDKGFEPLFLDVDVLCPEPNWNLNAANYQYTMNVTTHLVIEGDTSKDENDIIAAFVGGEFRGKGRIEKAVNGKYLAFITVHSNSLTGETVTFSAWDASECMEYAMLDITLPFVKDSIVGSLTNPLTMSTTGVVVQEIQLNKGWTWFSMYTNSDSSVSPIPVNTALASLNPKSGDIIKNQIATSQFYDTLGGIWSGTVTNIDNKQTYKIKLDNDDVLRFAGNRVNPLLTPVTINQGWNYIGYPVAGNTTINQAMSSLNAVLQTGDIIKSQFGYAEYISGDGWYGSLKFMEPGLGYMLKSSGPGMLYYPNFKTSRNRSIQNNEVLKYDARFAEVIETNNWEYKEHDYFMVNNITGSLYTHDEIQLQGERMLVSAFVGDECRGVGYAVKFKNSYVFYMSVYTNPAVNEKLSFKAYIEGVESVLDIKETVSFGEGVTTYGTTLAPFKWHLVESEAEANLDVENSGYYLLQNSPNPFVQRTNITFGTPKDGNVQIKLYNMQGQLIRTLLDRKMTAGEHTLILNATELGMQGVYYYTMQSGNFYDSKKIVIVNIEE